MRKSPVSQLAGSSARYTRLDHVGFTLGNLYRIYNTPSLEAPIRDQVLNSLEKRWHAADQDVFILAMHLHPWIRGRCFTKTLSRSTLYNMVDNIFRQEVCTKKILYTPSNFGDKAS